MDPETCDYCDGDGKLPCGHPEGPHAHPHTWPGGIKIKVNCRGGEKCPVCKGKGYRE